MERQVKAGVSEPTQALLIAPRMEKQGWRRAANLPFVCSGLASMC